MMLRIEPPITVHHHTQYDIKRNKKCETIDPICQVYHELEKV